MDAAKFDHRLSVIVGRAQKEITELVNQAQADEGLSWDTDKPINFVDETNWQRTVDSLAETAGWIYDRLAGKNRLAKRSVTKRIRKALGYTYP